MALNLSTPVESLRSVGPANSKRLKRLGINTLRDLLWHIPSRYEDFTQQQPIAELQVGAKVTIQGEVVKTSIKRIFPRHMTVVEAIIKDDSGAIPAVWFNQAYIATALPEGARVSLAGKVQLNKRGVYLASPTYEKLAGDGVVLKHTAGLIPVYPETEGITSKYLRFLIQPVLKNLVLDDPLPADVRAAHDLPELAQAVHDLHYPLTIEDAQRAKRRLAFDDLLLFQLKALVERRRVRQQRSVPAPFNAEYIKQIIGNLPFTLTGDQKIAAWEIFTDLGRSYPMNRLLQGDVGSGKTVVAFLAAAQVAQHGLQTAFLVPTEVLARQHYDTVRRAAQGLPVSVALLTASQIMLDGQEIEKSRLKRLIAAGKVAIVIGTHAVIQKSVAFGKLALVVVDEQHRFGITQRAALIKAKAGAPIPHLLSMTATPIPRTLALTIFGDLDISLIQQKPHDRKEIITTIVPTAARAKAYRQIDEEIGRGRQVFFICPRIQADQHAETTVAKLPKKLNLLWQEVRAVTQEYERLATVVFPHRKIAMLHGKMKPREKQSVMTAFKNGWYDLLVATSVVEVGVDIPNATVMAIENADRFGLAQLHQFRGRVGRSSHQSYCFLFTDDQETVNARLAAMTESASGFDLAEKDMALRGPGEFFGIKQSGMPDLTMAALADMELIKKARLQARVILKQDPSLRSFPLLVQRLAEFQRFSHFE